jgi:uncharacterized membrane protein YhaH (DUF805 family)
METLFEFMFGASGRINRAEYWLSILKFTAAGLFAAVILATAAELQRRFSLSRSFSS